MRVEFGAMRIAYTEAVAEFMASRHLRLADRSTRRPASARSAILLKQRTRSFSPLGVAGERLQREIDALLTKLAAEPETQASCGQRRA